MLLVGAADLDDIRHLAQPSAEVEFCHGFQPDVSPFILP